MVSKMFIRETSSINDIFLIVVTNVFSTMLFFFFVINTLISPFCSHLISGDFLVKSSFDEQLQTLREQLEQLQTSAEKELNKAARDLDLESGKSIKMESNPNSGFNFRYVKRHVSLHF